MTISRKAKLASVVVACALAIGLVAIPSCRNSGKREPQASQPGELTALGLLYGTDKTRDHHFTEIYEAILGASKNKVGKLLEIGIDKGASLRMWEAYFPNATIHGMDILDHSSMNSQRVKTFVADQGDRRGLQAFISVFGGDFDVIIDDGGHTMAQQQVSFGYLFKYLKPGGYYIIEDVHTSLFSRFGGAFGATPNGEKTTLAMIEKFIRTGTITSEFMQPAEAAELTGDIETCTLFGRDRGGSITSVFRKRAVPAPR